MSRSTLRIVILVFVSFFVGIGAAAMVAAYIPDSGSPPSIYDEFSWNSTANGFWHVNAVGASADIKGGLLNLSGNSIELDRRIQTDPYEIDIAAKVRGLKFHKFSIGTGVFHAGTVGLEFDDDGIKCGRGSDYGWKVTFVQGWHRPPVGQWFYLQLKIKNPYPTAIDTSKIPKSKLKHVTMTCSAYDAGGHLLNSVNAVDPPPNANYGALDEAFLRTWDSNNRYQVDWFYAGPPSGNPMLSIAR